MTAPSSAPPKDRYCDLVMKGGITSGVVYPKAIALLAAQYRFRSIGGTSAGAIAATVTAAAEYQRRNTESSAGFDLLSGLPEELQHKVDGSRSRLLSLFQPQPGTRRLFTVLIASLNAKGTYRRMLRILAGFLMAYGPATLLSVVIGVLAYSSSGILAGILAFLIAIGVTIAAWVYRDLTRAVVRNGFGLCTGMSSDAQLPALTPWLNDLIQRAAGRTAQDAPLTFGDLWNAPGFPPPWLELPQGAVTRSIDLQMFSTNLAHGRPYILPLQDPKQFPLQLHARERLYFRRAELAAYLPANVLQWVCDHAKPYRVEPGREGKDPDDHIWDDLLEVPDPADFPVLLAARMSLSFPVLFSAVPFLAIDHDAPPGQRRFRHCWFSDGGICSNFPMHLFDGLVPLWPTFGIDLEPVLKGRGPIYLPQRYDEGFGERWRVFAESRNDATKLGGFLGALIGAMQNWNDAMLARMPGVRDRVARVRLNDHEGGLNLDMEKELIAAIAARGEEAAKLLLQHFAELPTGGAAPGWNDHRMVRLNVLLNMLEARAPGILSGLSGKVGHATDFRTLFTEAMNRHDGAGRPVPPSGYLAPFTAMDKHTLEHLVQALEELARLLVHAPQTNPFYAVPRPELRVRPPL